MQRMAERMVVLSGLSSLLMTTEKKAKDEEDAMEEVTHVDVEDIEALIKEINERIMEKGGVFELVGPEQLTVKKADGSFSKRPHIGGESFHVTSCYAGKKHGLIFSFRPTDKGDALKYAQMEMSENQATNSLSGFREWRHETYGYDVLARKASAQREAALDAERAANKQRSEVYSGLGYGSW